MVCPNCHSHNIIAVQDQLFCINCGQMVPAPEGQTAKAALAADPGPVAVAVAEPAGDAAPAPAKGKLSRIRKKSASKDKPADKTEPAAPEAVPSTEPAPAAEPKSEPKPEPSDQAPPQPEPAKAGLLGGIIKISRQRIGEPPSAEGGDGDKEPASDSKPDEQKPSADASSEAKPEPAPEPEATAPAAAEEPNPKPRKQKPGRPRKRLDVPVAVAANAPLPSAPKLAAATPGTPDIRRMSDITPKPSEPEPSPEPAPEPIKESEKPPAQPKHRGGKSHPHDDKNNKVAAKDDKSAKNPLAKPLSLSLFGKPHAGHAKPAIHKVGLPPLHYATVLNFSLRARVRPHWLVLSALALAALLSAFIYGGWLLVTVPPKDLANHVLASGPQLLAELLVLAALYYVGRSISQTAIIYGIAREADARPVSLSRQLGAGVNTFSRRLVLDLTFGIIDLTLLGLMLILFITGGSAWPISPELQVVAIFVAYLILLYLLTGLAMARGLAGVAITLTPKETWPAISFGWQLFSHRFELISLRFLALAMELLLALPLAALALAMIMTAPDTLHPAVALGIGLLAWLAGALLGAGTAAWWAALYRRLILADHHHHNDSTEAVALLSSRQPQDARRAPLTLIVAISSFLLAAALAIPWFRIK